MIKISLDSVISSGSDNSTCFKLTGSGNIDPMKSHKHVFTVKYYKTDDGFYIGALDGYDDVYTNDITLEGLRDSIIEVYNLMRDENIDESDVQVILREDKRLRKAFT